MELSSNSSLNLNATYVVKDGLIEIRIKRGEISRSSLGSSPKWVVSSLAFDVAQMVGPNLQKNIAKANRIEINKTLNDGDTYRLPAQTVILKDDRISLANATNQWITATLYCDFSNSGSPIGHSYDSLYYYGTKIKVDKFDPANIAPAPPPRPAPAKQPGPAPGQKLVAAQQGWLRFELQGYEVSQDAAASLFISHPASMDPKALLAATTALVGARKGTILKLPFVAAASGSRAIAEPVGGYALEAQLTRGGGDFVEVIYALRRTSDQSGTVNTVLTRIDGITFMGSQPGSSADTVVLMFARLTVL